MATSLNQKIVQRLDNHMSRAVGKGNARAAVINSTRGMIGSFTPVSADLPWERHDTATLMAFAERVAANGGTTRTTPRCYQTRVRSDCLRHLRNSH